MRNAKGQFVAGIPPGNRMPVGTIRIRTRHKRYGEQRAFIKIAEPNTWELLARYRWEQAYGPIPHGMGIHHKDGDTLHDSLENLEIVTKKEHLAHHRSAFKDKALAASIATRKKRRWSTKSLTKHTGRPRTWTENQLRGAMSAYRHGEGTQWHIEQRFGLPFRTLSKHRHLC